MTRRGPIRHRETEEAPSSSPEQGVGRKLLLEIFRRLLDRFGPQHWWPGESPFEVMVGAVLTQNAAWANVEKALRTLKARGELRFQTLLSMPEDILAQRLRPCGYFRVKTTRLKNLLRAVALWDRGDLEAFLARPTQELREILLSVPGIGPETADSILLYAAQRPVFVIDAYTRRILSRHGWSHPKASYEQLQALFMDRLPPDVPLFNEYHALLVALGKSHCRPRPRCRECPLESFPRVSPPE